MKKLILTATAVFTLASAPVLAQSSNSSAQSSSSASQSFQGQSTAIAGSSGNQVIIDQSTPANRTVTTRQSGSSTTRVESAPSLGGLAVGGGHPCAYSPATGQFSVIGGGAGFGGMQIDEACMLAVMAAASGSSAMQQAALAIIGGRDPAACKAMYQQGLVADCLDRKGNSTVKAAPVAASSRNTAAPTAPKLYTSCRYDQAKNQIMIKYTAQGRKDKTSAAIACQRSLGM